MPGTPGARTGLEPILTGDPAPGYRTTINDVIAWLEGNGALISELLAVNARTKTVRDAPVPAITANNYADVDVTFPAAFADANYSATAEIRVVGGSFTFTQGPQVISIVAKTAAKVTVRVRAGAANLGSGDGHLDVIAIHD